MKVSPLQTLLKRGLTPTLKSVNQFLLLLFQSRRLVLVVHFFSQLNSNKIRGNSRTHSIVTRALLKLHKYEEAENFIKTSMVKTSNLSSHGLWDSLIQGLCIKRKDPEKALSLLRDCLRNHGMLPSSFTFCSLVHGFSSQGNMSKAIEVLELMSDEKIKYPFDNFVCSSVISGFCKIGKPEFAVDFFKNAIKSGALRPNLVTYTALVGSLCKLGKVHEVYDLVGKMENEGVTFDVVFYSSWICGFISGGFLEEMLRKKSEMIRKGIRPDSISYTIMIDGFSKLGDVEKAVGFLKKMMNDGIEPNSVTFTAIMLGFCEKGKMEEASSVFEMVGSLGIEVDEFMYATLINGYCKKGVFDLVFNLLDEMEKRGISPSIVTYNTVMNGLCKFGRTCEADEISKGIHGDTITYSTLLHGYIKEENIAGILKTKERLEEAGVCLDVVMCNVLIKALFMVGAIEDVYALYKEMQEKQMSADSVTYCTMIVGYCKVGRIHEALEIFNDFRSTTVSSVACYSCIISGLCNKGMVDMATDMLIELIEKGLALDRGLFVLLLKAVLQKNSAASVSSLVYRLEKAQTEFFDSLCNDIISFLCRSGYLEGAVEAFLVMRRKGLIPTVKSYYSVITGLETGGQKWLSEPLLANILKEYGLFEPTVCKILAHHLCLKDINKALYFLDMMKNKYTALTLPCALFKALIKNGRVLDAYKLVVKAEDFLPVMDAFFYSNLIDGLCKRGYVGEAIYLFSLSKRKGITLNIVSYNSVIYGLCQQGNLVEALRLFESLEKIDLVPSEITYATLIDALCREGFLSDAIQLFNRMFLVGFKPNIRLYNSVINGYCKMGKVKEALKLLYDLEIKCLKPDKFTVSALINVFCRKGDMQEALEYYFEFKRKGVIPDFLGFMYLIRGLSAKGRMEEARSILREMLQSQLVMELIKRVDVEFDIESLESLLSSLCEEGRINEAVTVLNEVGLVFFPPRRSSGAYDGPYIPKESHDREAFGITNLSSELSDLKNAKKLIKSQFNDFDFCCSMIASLCSRGETQKASQLTKEILAI